MKRSTRWVAVLAFGGALLLPASPASAEERVCRGTLGAVRVDNLRVPQGASCTLNGTHVKGTVKVERNATLRATGIRVIGNVQAENARNVIVRGGSRVGGSVQIVQGGAAQILGSTHQRRHLVRRPGRAPRRTRTASAAASRRSRTPAGSRSTTTGSTGTSSARRTCRRPPEAATSSRATRKTSARRL